MLFNSYVFIFAFLPIALAGFGLLGGLGTRRAGIVWLVICSLVFYGYWSPRYLLLLLFSMVVNYLIGTLWLSAPTQRFRKLGLIVGLVFNLSVLGFFKYTGLLLSTFAALTGNGMHLPDIILPLGISFFTFQKIAYLVDMYNGRGYSRNIVDYCLFVVFFPQLIAGPIVHPREMLPQFSRRSAFGLNPKNLSIGTTLFVIGLVKKVLIADSISRTASMVFDDAAKGIAPGFCNAWLAAITYAMQIYFDFSGYTDMAIGLARMFGIRLPLNFNSPYKATSISDFWRRWHMTLSRFLREYLYIPLGGNRKGPARRYLNLMITMLLGGLWHGANWTFMFWGGLHGIYLVIHHAFSRGRQAGPIGVAGIIWRRGLTFVAVVVAWVFFRADTFRTAGRMLADMLPVHGLDLHAFSHDLSRSHARWPMALACVIFVFFAPNTQEVMASGRPALGVLPPPPGQRRRVQWRPNLAWSQITAVAFVAAVICLSRASEFIYYQF